MVVAQLRATQFQDILSSHVETGRSLGFQVRMISHDLCLQNSSHTSSILRFQRVIHLCVCLYITLFELYDWSIRFSLWLWLSNANMRKPASIACRQIWGNLGYFCVLSEAREGQQLEVPQNFWANLQISWQSACVQAQQAQVRILACLVHSQLLQGGIQLHCCHPQHFRVLQAYDISSETNECDTMQLVVDQTL